MSLSFFEGFKFSKLPTPIHQMDPRAKFLMIISIFISALIFSEILALLIIFLLELPLVIIAKCTKRWLWSLKGSSFLATLIFLINLLTTKAIIASLSMSLRFIILLSSFSIFFMTTSPDDLGLAMEKFHMPYSLTFTFITAVRLVPTMAIDAQTIIDAQKSRGLELEKGSIFKRIKNYIPILIPLIVCAIRRSIELAEALESRAFNLERKRESLITLKMKNNDYMVSFLSIVIIMVSIYVRTYIQLPNFEIYL
ncbi:MAG: energy-coupling factor transporter transmembrane component T [Candidatus Bathyarchaeia archaeon]